MTHKHSVGCPGLVLAACIIGMLAGAPLAQSSDSGEPIRHTLTFEGVEREYFVQLPPTFDRQKSYWPLVVVHGSGGNGRTFFLSTGIAAAVAEAGLNAIVISPSFPNDDNNGNRFPVLRDGRFLQEILNEVRRQLPLKSKILLTGYSRGGQFAHRFALAHPSQVEAVAPFASGTWTTPDGRFLVEGLGEVKNAQEFFSNASNASAVPGRLRDLFERRVATVVESRAAGGAPDVPFLVMCGTVDPRLAIAQEFVSSLQALGYHVRAEWPRTPHRCGDDECRSEYAAEFQKYSNVAVDFFQQVTRGK